MVPPVHTGVSFHRGHEIVCCRVRVYPGRMAGECDPPNATECPGPAEARVYGEGNAYLEVRHSPASFRDLVCSYATDIRGYVYKRLEMPPPL